MPEMNMQNVFVKIGGTTVDGVYSYTVDEEAETIDVSDWADFGSGRNYVMGFQNWGGSFQLRLQDNKALPAISGAAISFACGKTAKIDRTGDAIITAVNETFEATGEVTVNFIGTGALNRAVTVA